MTTINNSTDYLALIKNGLPMKATNPQKVIVVGAGMAGLVAAYELLRAGHEPLILEAQTRLGGRIYTMRDPFSEGLYAEAGAMRIPKAHTLTMAYIDKFNLPTSPFTMDNPEAFYCFNGARYRINQCLADPDCLGFQVAENERGRHPGKMWADALLPLAQKVEREGQVAWDEITADHDRYSVREFLEEVQAWSEGAIERFGLIFNQEALMNSSFMELLREELGACYTDMIQIDGGMDNLPRAFFPVLKDRINFGAQMVAIDQSPGEVTVYYRTLPGTHKVSGDYAILAVPTTILRHVEILKPFSPGKRRAIRQLHYDASAKIFFQCRRRFWELDDGIYGGGSATDLAVRNIFYPEHGRESGRGVLLASYTWGEDAQRWGSLAPHERLSQALENVAQIHPQVTEAFEGGASKMWHDDPFAGGAFALFDPGQQSLLHEHIISPEGRIHFAGEHASLHHAWIQGAIESGLRAALEIHQASSGI